MIGQASAFNEAALEGRRAFLDTGAANAALLIYGNTRPGVAGAAAGASALVTLELAKPCGIVAGNVLTLDPIAASFIVLNSGSPAWARLVNGNGDFAMDCDVGVEVLLSDTTVIAGGSVALISAVFG